MAKLNFRGLSSYTQAESLVSKDNLELAKQQQSYLRNSDRSFAWEQVAKYTGIFLAATITGLSAGFATLLGANATLLIGGIAALAAVSISAGYVAYKIRANNSINSNEITAHSTGREIAAELRRDPISVSVTPTIEESAHGFQPTNYNKASEPQVAFHEAGSRIATADAELISTISNELEPLSTGR